MGQERTAHINRIRALLVLNNLRVKYVGGRMWQRWWTGHAQELPPCVRAEIERESARLLLVKKQMDTIEAEQRQAVAAGSEAQVAGLAQLRGIGMSSGWVLAKELFGWRRFRNRREVAGCLGLTPSPYASGESETEQGISKAGNWRARTLMVELAWICLTSSSFPPPSQRVLVAQPRDVSRLARGCGSRGSRSFPSSWRRRPPCASRRRGP